MAIGAPEFCCDELPKSRRWRHGATGRRPANSARSDVEIKVIRIVCDDLGADNIRILLIRHLRCCCNAAAK